MINKIEKLRSERRKNEKKIALLNERNREIDDAITELENSEIVGLVRETGMTIEELAAFLKKVRGGESPLAAGRKMKGAEEGKAEEVSRKGDAFIEEKFEAPVAKNEEKAETVVKKEEKAEAVATVQKPADGQPNGKDTTMKSVVPGSGAVAMAAVKSVPSEEKPAVTKPVQPVNQPTVPAEKPVPSPVSAKPGIQSTPVKEQPAMGSKPAAVNRQATPNGKESEVRKNEAHK